MNYTIISTISTKDMAINKELELFKKEEKIC